MQQLSFKSKGKQSVIQSNMLGKINRHIRPQAGWIPSNQQTPVCVSIWPGNMFLTERTASRSDADGCQSCWVRQALSVTLSWLLTFGYLVWWLHQQRHAAQLSPVFKPACIANCAALAAECLSGNHRCADNCGLQCPGVGVVMRSYCHVFHCRGRCPQVSG